MKDTAGLKQHILNREGLSYEFSDDEKLSHHHSAFIKGENQAAGRMQVKSSSYGREMNLFG